MTKKILTILPIVALWFMVVATNFQQGTILSGWDNLHPEFAPWVNISRSLTTLWQEYQGVGLLGGMAHAADLPRQVLFALVSLFLPMELMRYSWTFFMLLIGPLGVYAFFSKKESSLAGTVAGISYLANLATLQYFYTPFEAFISFFGFFPWLLTLAKNYLDNGSKKSLAAFATLSLFAATGFYIQTLFVVFFLSLSAFIFPLMIKIPPRTGKRPKENIKRVAKLYTTILFVNAFWLLPVIYFSFANGEIVSHTKINSIATPETQLMNQANGNLGDIALLKGFWFDYTDAREGEFEYLMPEWRSHLGSPLVQTAGYSVAVLSFTGYLLAFKKKTKYALASFLGLVLSVLMLTAGNGVLGIPFKFLSDAVPLFAEMFRSSFTKWSVAAAFFMSLGLGFFVYALNKKLIAIVALLPILIFSPAFKGHLFSPDMRVSLPSEYISLFDYFNNEPEEGRIAFFPVQSFWGWNFYDWDYRGSGFLWYGIKQPILDRAFDVWSIDNESFYQEASTAVYANDKEMLARVLEKYNVTYVLLDENVTVPSGEGSTLRFQETKNLLSQLEAEVSWSQESLTVYKLLNTPEHFLFAPEKYANINAKLGIARKDSVYQNYGLYAETKSSQSFPFSNVSGEKVDAKYTKNLEGAQFVTLERVVPLPKGSYSLTFPAFTGENTKITALATYTENVVRIEPTLPSVSVNGEIKRIYNTLPMELTLPGAPQEVILAVGGSASKLTNPTKSVLENLPLKADEGLNVSIFDAANFTTLNVNQELFEGEYEKCWQRTGFEGEFTKELEGDTLKITSRDAVGCKAVKLGALGSESAAIEVSLPYRSGSGARPHFCLVEEGTSECLNQEVYYHTPTSANWAEVTRVTVVPGSKTYWLILSGRPPEEPGKSWTIEYKPLSIRVYSLLVKAEYPDVFSEATQDVTLNLNEQIENVSVTVPVSSQPIDFSTDANAQNCDVFGRGEVTKNLNTYKASGRGAVCDYQVAPNVVTTGEYLLRLRGENKKGRGVKFYAYNPASMRPDIEALLAGENFDSSFSLLSWPNYQSEEYTVSTEVRSFGHLAQTTLTDVTAYSYPLSWVGGIHIAPSEASLYTQNTLEVSNVKKIGTVFYTAQVSSQNDSSLIVLSQGYDKGWVAKKGSVFGKSLEHVEVNSWQNGWLTQTGDYNVLIFYWPQVVQSAGLLLLLLTVLVVLI